MDVIRLLRIIAAGVVSAGAFSQLARTAEPDCEGRYVAQAEFGKELGTANNTCPGIPMTEDQDCAYLDGGIRYGVSQGWMVNKEITQTTYSGRLPLGLRWGEKISVSEQKILKITQGDPKLLRTDEELNLGDNYCLLTKSGHGYHLELYFDQSAGGLSKIIGRILYP